MRSILIIDDEKSTLRIFRLFLSAYGYKVLTAENGKLGVEVFNRERPRIVLTDIKMPGMDGLEVLKRIKEADPSTEVIVITGHGDMDLAIQALDLYATDFINKPIQKEALDAALNRAEKRLSSPGCGEDNRIEIHFQGDATILDIRGNLTARSESPLLDAYEKIRTKGSQKIIFLLEENCSINRGGISVLTGLLSRIRGNDQTAVIKGLSNNFKKIFEMAGITKYASLAGNDDQAMDVPAE
jgi:YesN/AraC family two-component response regulator